MSTDAADPEVRDDELTADEAGAHLLFDGDVGQLGLAVRETLVTLLKRRYISAERHSRDWRVVLENEASLRSRLNDVFLELVVDRDYEVAYKRQAVPEGGGRFATLLYDKEYNREETILLVHLRRLLRTVQQTGDEVAFVQRAELLEEVGNYRPTWSTNHVRDRRGAENAVDSLLKSELLLRTSDPDRFRVATIVEVLLPVGRIQELTEWLRARNDAQDTDGTTDDGTTGDGDETAEEVDDEFEEQA